MKSAFVIAALFLASPAVAQLGGSQQGIGKSPPTKGTLSAPGKSTLAPPAAAGTPSPSAVPQQADLRIVKVEHKVVMQGCKASMPFAEVVATVRNKGGTASAGLNDPSAIAAVFKVQGGERRFSAAGGLMPLPAGGSQVVVMKIPFDAALFPVEKLPDGWVGRKHSTTYQVQVNSAGLIDESEAANKGALHTVEVTKEQCPDLFHTIPPFDTFAQFQGFCQKAQQQITSACFGNVLNSSFLSAEQAEAQKKLPDLCNACKAACPTCDFKVKF